VTEIFFRFPPKSTFSRIIEPLPSPPPVLPPLSFLDENLTRMAAYGQSCFLIFRLFFLIVTPPRQFSSMALAPPLQKSPPVPKPGPPFFPQCGSEEVFHRFFPVNCSPLSESNFNQGPLPLFLSPFSLPLSPETRPPCYVSTNACPHSPCLFRNSSPRQKSFCQQPFNLTAPMFFFLFFFFFYLYPPKRSDSLGQRSHELELTPPFEFYL